MQHLVFIDLKQITDMMCLRSEVFEGVGMNKTTGWSRNN
jgi:hypothetical protein